MSVKLHSLCVVSLNPVNSLCALSFIIMSLRKMCHDVILLMGAMMDGKFVPLRGNVSSYMMDEMSHVNKNG